MARRVTFKEVGPPNTPQEIKRLRRENMDLCRRMGQPIILRHLFNRDDVQSGVAKECPACYDETYGQVRADCVVCYGFGFVSVEDNPEPIYITSDGTLIETMAPGPGLVRAPRYGGFDVPILTWLVEPDIAVDVFRINDQGLLTHQYDATGVAPWYPTVGDNDLCINVTLEGDGFTVASVLDRFQLKRVQQITIRGLGARARAGSNGQPYLVAQSFQMNKSPDNQNLYSIPVDAAWY
jgi:hypothetical protein